MAEIRIDISKNRTKSVSALWQNGEVFEYVIAVCDKEVLAKCPLFLGIATRLHCSLPDPSKVTGTPERKLRKEQLLRDEINARIQDCLPPLPVEETV